MRHSTFGLLLLVSFTAVGCEGMFGLETETRYNVRPSSALAERIETAPSDFTWDLFRRELFISAEGVEDTVQLELRALQIQGGEVIDGSTVGPVPVGSDRLAEGATSGELRIPGQEWSPGPAPGDEWFSTVDYRPKSWISPTEFQFPGDEAVVSAVLERVTLGSGEGVVIVYPRAEGAASDQLEVSPFALILSP